MDRVESNGLLVAEHSREEGFGGFYTRKISSNIPLGSNPMMAARFGTPKSTMSGNRLQGTVMAQSCSVLHAVWVAHTFHICGGSKGPAAAQCSLGSPSAPGKALSKKSVLLFLTTIDARQGWCTSDDLIAALAVAGVDIWEVWTVEFVFRRRMALNSA